MSEEIVCTFTSQTQEKWGRIFPLIPTLPTLDLTKDEYKIGRSNHCDVVISSTNIAEQMVGSISKVHFIITKDVESNKVCCTDVSKNGTFINAVKIQRNARIYLKDGDKISFGKNDYYAYVYRTYQNDELPDTLTPKETTYYKEPVNIPTIWGRLIPYIKCLESVDLTNPSLKVGRSPHCDVNVNGMNLSESLRSVFSKEHFIICKDSNNLITYITDLSKSGTYLNGNLIGKNRMQILQNDDVIGVVNKKNNLYLYKCMYTKDLDYLPQELRGRYELSKVLGKGGAGEVTLAFEKNTCEMFAIKKILKARSTTSQMYRLNHPSKIQLEVDILRNVSHPFIIKMREIVETSEEVFIVLDYMKGGELTNRILSTVPLTESNVKFLFLQMVLAVQFLHSQGITHRDLKPENVLLASDEVETLIKVSDFGLSKITEDNELMKTFCGTHGYIAPEVLGNRKPYDRQVDVWSLGVILFYMLSKELPFKSSDKDVLFAQIVNGHYSMDDPCWDTISDSAKDLVSEMLTVQPQNRITISNILKHAWLATDHKIIQRVQSLLLHQ